MAEEGSVYDFKGLEKQLQSLFSRFTCNELQADSKPFCSDFCKLVEEYASHWQVPLPQLRILEIALCYFTRVSAFLTVNCGHVLNTLSSLALSIFELLLFFEQKDFCQEPLKKITVTFQECCLVLAKHQNVHLLQVERLLQAGGPWASQSLQAILSESSLPQTEVDGCVSSEPPVFFELRVRYLLSCQRLAEALALAKCCAQHPRAGQHLFFLQVYLTWLYKTSQYERLHKELADFSGKDAVHIICSLESEEKDELLLAFNRAFLSQQLRRGDMHFLGELVFIWSKLHSRLKTSKEALLKECHQLMLCATDVNSIFPFIRVIIQELSEDGVQFCVELCANALRTCLPCDVVTKSLIYKMIASLLPNDLEICRACALLVFFLERSVEAYKMVYILYMHPDQEYHVDCCPIGNNIRFETLQVLKKDLYFDPEFWNLIALRTNCLKLMNEKVLSAALEEIMEEKWVPNYCLKEPKLSSSKKGKGLHKAKKRHHKEDQQNHRDGTDTASKRLKVRKTQINNYHSLRKKGNQGTRQWKEVSLDPLRRSSLWQLDRIHSNRAMNYGENRRTTRLSEKIPAKRKIRKPKWLLEDSGTLENNAPLKVRRYHQRLHYTSIGKRSEAVKNNTKDTVNSDLKVKENDKKNQKEVPLDSLTASTPQVILELSLPDNELMGTFSEETCNRQRGFPQMLFYRPTVKIPSAAQPEKPADRNEVILRAQDAATFMQMLHCYARRPKGKANRANSQGSASTITRSSGQASASKEDQLCDKPAVEMKVTISSQTHKVTDKVLKRSRERRELHDKSAVIGKSDRVKETKLPQSRSLATVLSEESAVEMKVTVASQKHRHSPRLEKTQPAEHVSDIVSHTSTAEKKQAEISDQILPFSLKADEHSLSQDSLITNGEVLLNGTLNQEVKSLSSQTENGQISLDTASVKGTNSISEAKTIHSHTTTDNRKNRSALTSGTDMKTVVDLYPATDNSASVDSKTENNTPHQKQSTSSCSPPQNTAWEETQEVSQEEYESVDPPPECEESKLEYCCTFCHKDFKGSRVVAHAMFHYRKDECMFCGMAFRDDLKAMMHLSNHIEKLKKSKKSQEKHFSKTKDRLKSSVKAKTTSLVNGKRSRGRPKKSCPIESRKLRSSNKLSDGQKQNEQSNAKDLRSKTLTHKVNGKIGKNKDSDRIEKEVPLTKTKLRQGTVREINNVKSRQQNDEMNHNSSASVKKENEKSPVCSIEEKNLQKITSKANKQTDTEKQERLCCPVDGCSWFTDKNRVALLYHALEDHHADTQPLELAFRMANNKCSICKRVLWSFEHFRHHVERHRLVPRHPCLHKGCTARFKSGMEMRRHARKHSPLQAMCCRPGCSKLFICLWALNLHEKDHYSKSSSVDIKKDKQKNTQVEIKQEDDTAKDRAKKKNESVKSSRKLRIHNSVKSSLSDTNKSKDSSVSKKNLSAQPAAARLLQKLRKRHITKAILAHQRTHKILFSVRKPNGNVRHSLRKKEVNLNAKHPNRKTVPPPSTKSSMQDDNSVSENQKRVTKPAKISVESKKSKEKAKVDSDGTEDRKLSRKQEKVTNVKATRKIVEKISNKTSNSETPKNTEKAKSVDPEAKHVAAAVVESSFIEANMKTTDTTDNIAPIISSNNSTETEEKEQETQRKLTTQVANITSVKPENKEKVSGQNRDKKEPNENSVVQNVKEVAVHVLEGAVVEEKATDSVMDTGRSFCAPAITFAVQEDELVAAAEGHSNAGTEQTDSSANSTSDSALITSIVLKAEQVPIPHGDNSTSSDSPVNSNNVSALSVTSIVEKVEHVSVQVVECSAVEDNAKMDTTDSSVNDDRSALAMTDVAEKVEHITAVEDATINKNSEMDPTESSTNDTMTSVVENVKHVPEHSTVDEKSDKETTDSLPSINNGSGLEQVEKTSKIETTCSILNTVLVQKDEQVAAQETAVEDNSQNMTNKSNSLNGASGEMEPQKVKRNKRKLCFEGEAITLAKPKKKDKVNKNEDKKNKKRQRNQEHVKKAAPKKSKSVAQNVEESLAVEGKAMIETTDSSPSAIVSCAPAITNSINEISKEGAQTATVKRQKELSHTVKEKEAKSKKQGRVDSKNKAEKNVSSKNVGDEKKRKREPSKTVKSKAIDIKVEAKAAEVVTAESLQMLTPADLASISSEVNGQPTNSEEIKSRRASHKVEGVKIKKRRTNTEKPKKPTKPKVQKVEKKNHDETCLKNSEKVYDLVPEEEESPLVAFEKALTEYKKKPYMRLPATAYLEERYTTMPKRRKDMSMFFGASRRSLKAPEKTVTPQKQRCANCFATFSSEEDLQLHLQQKCSSLFGFESDDEGTS